MDAMRNSDSDSYSDPKSQRRLPPITCPTCHLGVLRQVCYSRATHSTVWRCAGNPACQAEQVVRIADIVSCHWPPPHQQ